VRYDQGSATPRHRRRGRSWPAAARGACLAAAAPPVRVSRHPRTAAARRLTTPADFRVPCSVQQGSVQRLGTQAAAQRSGSSCSESRQQLWHISTGAPHDGSSIRDAGHVRRRLWRGQIRHMAAFQMGAPAAGGVRRCRGHGCGCGGMCGCGRWRMHHAGPAAAGGGRTPSGRCSSRL
jgi:hypothetical protein